MIKSVTNNMSKPVTNGYWEDGSGRLVPSAHVPEYEKDKDDLVRGIVRKALELQTMMAMFKKSTMGDIDAWVCLAAERYQAEVGGRKGNVQMTTFDGRYRIGIAVAERVAFDERLQVAKALIDDCIHTWSEGADTKICALVEHAFQTDKQGSVNIARVVSLTKLDIDDTRWAKAMDAIRDSMQVVSTAYYLQIASRDEATGRYRQIPLDMATV